MLYDSSSPDALFPGENVEPEELISLRHNTGRFTTDEVDLRLAESMPGKLAEEALSQWLDELALVEFEHSAEAGLYIDLLRRIAPVLRTNCRDMRAAWLEARSIRVARAGYPMSPGVREAIHATFTGWGGRLDFLAEFGETGGYRNSSTLALSYRPREEDEAEFKTTVPNPFGSRFSPLPEYDGQSFRKQFFTEESLDLVLRMLTYGATHLYGNTQISSPDPADLSPACVEPHDNAAQLANE